MNCIDFEITIVGGGCFGSSILHELSRRGYKNMCLIDRGRNTESATASSGGMLRVFHENPVHVELALANYELLNTFRHTGILAEKSELNGSLYFFNKNRFSEYASSLKKMETAQYPFEILNSTEGEKQFPQFKWHPEEWAIYEPLGTQLTPSIFTQDLLSESIRNGAKVLEDFEVQHIRQYRDHYLVFNNSMKIKTKALILSGGARLIPRFKELGVGLSLESKTLTTYVSKKEKSFYFPNYFDRETLDFAGFGHPGSVTLSKAHCDRTTSSFWEEKSVLKAAEDCYAPNRIGFSGQVPGQPQLVLATGWGGMGFKIALEIGNRVASSIERCIPERKIAYAIF